MFFLEAVDPDMGINPARWEVLYTGLQCAVFAIGALLGLKL